MQHPDRTRLDSLDLLRGIAILGILPMNVLGFALPFEAYSNPLAMGPLTQGEWWAWRVSHLVFDQKFITIFSALFGAGLLLLDAKATRAGHGTGWFLRRMGWLLAIGMLHAYLLWSGDILACYAIVGTLAWLLRRLPSGWLVAIGLALLAVPVLIALLLHALVRFMPAEAIEGMRLQWSPPREELERAIDAYRGGWLEQMPQRAMDTMMFQLAVFFLWALWRVGGVMLLGMVLLRSGFLAARWSTGAYASIALAGLAVGGAISGWGLRWNEAIQYAAPDAMTIGPIFNYVGSLFSALGWAAVAMLLSRLDVPASILPTLEGVGRTSLSNYLLQTAICTTIFYGHGLGWHGHVDRVHLLLVVLLVWLIQVTLTTFWLRRFEIGPVEWAWRSLADWRRLPIRPREA
ncbi:MAG: DUF418 domain-containing protein [Phycisphaerae bacterium]|nr:DUF418 domain-containing protein [Phycisphaerae bacterium]